jgi:hypothetical protein
MSTTWTTIGTWRTPGVAGQWLTTVSGIFNIIAIISGMMVSKKKGIRLISAIFRFLG